MNEGYWRAGGFTKSEGTDCRGGEVVAEGCWWAGGSKSRGAGCRRGTDMKPGQHLIRQKRMSSKRGSHSGLGVSFPKEGDWDTTDRCSHLGTCQTAAQPP